VSKIDTWIWVGVIRVDGSVERTRGTTNEWSCSHCSPPSFDSSGRRAHYSVCVHSRVHSMRVGRLPGTDIYRDIRRYERVLTTSVDRIHIYRFDAPLMFINVELFRDRLYSDCKMGVHVYSAFYISTGGINMEEARKMVNFEFERRLSKVSDRQRPTHAPSRNCLAVKRKLQSRLPVYIILDCSGFTYIDVSGIGTLSEIAGEMKEINVEVRVRAYTHNMHWCRFCSPCSKAPCVMRSKGAASTSTCPRAACSRPCMNAATFGTAT